MDARRTTLVGVFLAGLAAVLTGAVWQVHDSAGTGESRGRAAWQVRLAPGARPAVVTDATASTARVPAGVVLLRAWDAHRAAAWASGDEAALAALYTAASRTGARDRTMLRAYVRRGLVVRGLSEQVLAARIVSATRERVRLRVVDRLAAATAVGPGLSRELPRGVATRHVVDLLLVGRTWRVQEVRPG